MDIEITRVPRPKGITNLARQKQKNKLINHILNNYINNGFTYLNKPVSIEELSELIQIPESELSLYIIELSNVFTKMLSPESSDQAYKALRVLYSQALKFAFSDRSTYATLASSLAEGLYYPNTGAVKLPVASQLIRALEVGSKINTNFMAIIQSLTPSKTAVIQTESDTQSPTQSDAKPLTQTDALKMVEDMSQASLSDTSFLKSLYESYSLDSTPEVKALGGELGPKAILKAGNQVPNEEIIEDIEFTPIPPDFFSSGD